MQYTAFREGKSIGSFTAEQLREALSAGVLRPTDTYFGEGMPSIQTLAQLGKPVTSAAATPVATPPTAPQPEQAAASMAPRAPGRIDWDELPSGPVPTCCARCNSSDIKAVQLVYKMGQTSGSMAGMSLSGEIGMATTHNISELAAELGPPVKGTGAVAILFFGWIVGVVLGFSNDSLNLFYVCAVLSIIGSFAFGLSLSRAHAKNMYLWRNSWICFKCGHKFVSVAPEAVDTLRASS